MFNHLKQDWTEPQSERVITIPLHSLPEHSIQLMQIKEVLVHYMVVIMEYMKAGNQIYTMGVRMSLFVYCIGNVLLKQNFKIGNIAVYSI